MCEVKTHLVKQDGEYIIHSIHIIKEQIKYFALTIKAFWPNLRALSWKSVCDFQCFPVSHIWKHWLLMQKQKLLPGEQKYFLPNSETFDETLFLRLPTLVSQFVPGSEAAEASRK